jgi:membrane-bound ClpP family serine protease
MRESGGKMTTARLILAIVSTLAVEAALFTIWRWVLPEWEIEVPLAALITVMVVYAIFAVVDFWFVTLVLKKQAVVGLSTMIGSKGKVTSPLEPEGLVTIKGELWGAKSIDRDIASGELVTVVGQDGLKLIVRKASSSSPKRTEGKPTH